MLGNTVYQIFKTAGFEVIGVTRDELNAQTANLSEIGKIIQNCDYVINCIGIIKPYIHDTNSLEVERAIAVNSLFPHKLSQYGAKIIQIATDCVFDGIKGNYSETDKHNALDVYGKTKSLGEVSSNNFLNLRCSIIGLEKKGKLSLLEWFLNHPKNSTVNGFMNHQWNGISTIAFAKICRGIIENDLWFFGLQHILPNNTMNKSDMLKKFAEVFSRTDITINGINAKEAINRTLVTNNEPQNEKLWKNAGYNTTPKIEELIMEIKEYE